MKDNKKTLLQLAAKQIKKVAECADENHFSTCGFYRPAKPAVKGEVCR